MASTLAQSARIGSVFPLLVLLLSACVTAPQHSEDPQPTPTLAEPLPAPRPALRPLRIAAVGDIMLGTDFPQDRLPEAGGEALLAPVADTLRQADIAFGNLEGVLLDGGVPEKQCRSEACYLFRTPTAYAKDLAEAGIDVVSLANNHAMDFGEAGRDATMQALDAVGIRHSGRVGDVASWRVQGRRVGLIAFAPFRGSWPMLDLDFATAQVAQLAEAHDILIVSFHAGAEGDAYTRIPFEPEVFHGEDRGDVVAFARAVIDAGADLVLGHGPHVPRAVEVYRDRLVAYSLGNFCTHWGIKVSGYNGLAPILVADLGADGRLIGGRVVSAVQRRPIGTLPDGEHGAARLMQQLTELDFPDASLKIGQEGEFRLLPDRATAVAVSSDQ